MINTCRHFFYFLCIAALLSGCSNKITKPPLISEDWPKHQTQVQAIKSWQAIGKLGVKVPNDGGSATLSWQQQADRFQISLSGPFGTGKMNIEGNAKGVSLTEAGNKPQTAKTAEELIKKSTGWNIPVTQLAYWVRGLPDPNSTLEHVTPNASGLLGNFEQLGWKVSYSEYSQIITGENSVAMPNRIIAEFKDIRLTLVIREWRMEPAIVWEP